MHPPRWGRTLTPDPERSGPTAPTAEDARQPISSGDSSSPTFFLDHCSPAAKGHPSAFGLAIRLRMRSARPRVGDVLSERNDPHADLALDRHHRRRGVGHRWLLWTGTPLSVAARQAARSLVERAAVRRSAAATRRRRPLFSETRAGSHGCFHPGNGGAPLPGLISGAVARVRGVRCSLVRCSQVVAGVGSALSPRHHVVGDQRIVGRGWLAADPARVLLGEHDGSSGEPRLSLQPPLVRLHVPCALAVGAAAERAPVGMWRCRHRAELEPHDPLFGWLPPQAPLRFSRFPDAIVRPQRGGSRTFGDIWGLAHTWR